VLSVSEAVSLEGLGFGTGLSEKLKSFEHFGFEKDFGQLSRLRQYWKLIWLGFFNFQGFKDNLSDLLFASGFRSLFCE
jgi:hypothetical protein